MINKYEWCWDTAEEGQSVRGEAWSGRVCALEGKLEGRTLYEMQMGMAIRHEISTFIDRRYDSS